MKQKRGRKVRLADVAAEASVSLATASRVVNNPDSVSPELRGRVQRAMDAMNFVPSGAAMALASQKTRTVGMIVPSIGVAVFPPGVEALQQELLSNGYALVIANSGYDPQRELEAVRTLLRRGIDGLVLVGNERLPETAALIEEFRLPVIHTYVDRCDAGIHAVGFDQDKAAYEMTEYLVHLGHKDFGVITSPRTFNDRVRARCAAIARCLRAHKLKLGETRIVEVPYSIRDGRAALRTLLAADTRLTAIMCTTDLLAVGAVLEAQSLGQDVPGTLSITGFDDLEIASEIDPALTTVRVPTEEIGRVAAGYIIRLVAGEHVPRSNVIPAELVIRQSTGRPSNPRRGRGRPRKSSPS